MVHPNRIYFVRHAEVHNPDRVVYGRLAGFHLSDEGRVQARAVGEALRNVELAAIYSSPMPRAVETSEAIVPFHDGLQIEITDLINEVYTPYEGWPISEISERAWDFYTNSKPPYEQPSDVLARAQQFIAGVRSKHNNESVAAVTHGDVLAFLLLWATGRPQSLKERLDLYEDSAAKGSVTLLTYRTGAADEVPEIDYIFPPGGSPKQE